jgi:hypothetical protein
MKIISQSMVINKPNYFHLAYLATTSRSPIPGYFGAGLIVFLTGCVLSFKLSPPKTGSLPTNIVLRKQTPKGRLIGLFCVFIGAVVLLLSYKYGKLKYNHPHSLTSMQIHMLSNDISRSLADSNSFPEDIVIFPDSENWQTAAITKRRDFWSNQIQLKKITNDGQITYLVVSAGKDGIFETPDDITAEPITPSMITNLRIEIVGDQIYHRLNNGETIPENIATLPDSEKWKIPTAVVKDGWSKQMRIKKITNDNQITYQIVSAGKDGIFETEDDITSEPFTSKK